MTENLRTSDPDLARAELSTVYCPHRLSILGGAEGFGARHISGGFPGLRVHLLDYGRSDVEVAPVPFEDFVLVSRPVSGRFTVTCGDQRVASNHDAVVMDPSGKYQLQWLRGCRIVNIVLERRRFEAVAADLLGADSPQAVSFELGSPVNSSAAQAWDAVSRLLIRDIVPSGAGLRSELVRTQVLRLTVATLLEAYPGTFTRADDGATPWSGPSAIRRAVAFIEASADQDIDLSDIAAVSRTSVRGLQRGFRTHHGTTPLKYLREVRLRRAHAELKGSLGADEVSIAEIAYRWGFSSPSRFAEEHRRVFGCLPSDVVRGR